ncbi:serine carboxypeptidase [Mycena rosella]|uniref:Carboxypeptidase n=1 Tax=Mycena rosella TaxID=1033263 RepID=A0AAD7G075_MYCRO|nr:serine carboxypeptidase [Mycena rosella]
MRLPWLVLLAAISPVLAAKGPGQIPVRGGAIGGVGSFKSTTAKAEIPQSSVTKPGALRVVENSGVCETTPGVFQASGYGDIAANKSIFFWYFAARHNPTTAPLALWFNGGPGSSSMMGLLQELGPCRITNDSSSVTLNPYSWNNNANVLFIDQPVGVGFSYGTETVGTSQEAGADIWSFLQIFLKDARFSHLAVQDLAIWTESYGGHYGPTFATHFLTQNAAISAGTVKGLHLNLKTLGIGNGLTDPISQYPSYLTYAASNPYHPLFSADVLAQANISWNTPVTGCKALIIACNDHGNNSVCSNAQDVCNGEILGPLAADFDVYYVLSGKNDTYPPDLTSYLASVRTKIGGEVTWQQSNLNVYDNFAEAGDWMRTSLPDLESVIDSGVRVVIYDGDADYILNFDGVEAMIASLRTKFSTQFNQEVFKPYTVNGLLAGQFKTAGTFSYVRIYGAGHEVPHTRSNGTLAVGQAAFQFFQQTMAHQSLSAT